MRSVSGVGAFEYFCSFAQRSIWTNVCIECREEEIAITITEVNYALTFENLLGHPQKAAHNKIVQRLMRHQGCLFDFFFSYWIEE